MSPPEHSVNTSSQSVHDETLSNNRDGEVIITNDPSAGSTLGEDAVDIKKQDQQEPAVSAVNAGGGVNTGDLIDFGDNTSAESPTQNEATVEGPSAAAKGKQIADIQAAGVDDIETLSSSMATLKPMSAPTSNDTTSQYLTAEPPSYVDPTPPTPISSQPPSRTPSSAARSHHSTDRSPSRSDAEYDDKRYTSEDEQEGRSRSEIQSIMEQFSELGGGPGEEEVMSPRLEIASPMLGNPIQHPPRKSSLEPLASHFQELQGLRVQTSTNKPPSIASRDLSIDDHGPPVPPKDGSFSTPSRPNDDRSMNIASPSSPQVHRPPPPEPEPEPTLPFDFHRFLEQLRNKKADPVARYLKSFLSEFGKRQWMVHEQVKIIGDFLAFISNKMAQCEVWREVSDAEFDNAREGMEKLVMNRLYTQTFSPAIMPPKPIPGAKPKRKGADAPLGPGRRGQHQEDVERDDIVTQKINIYGWVREEHLDIPQVGDSGKRFLKLAQQELLKIKSYRAPRDKIICVLNCCKVIFGLLKHNKSDSSADSFMPLLIYVVLQSNPEHLVSNVQYILRFRNQEKLGGEAGYYLSSLMGAIQFIENMDRTTLTITDDEFEKHVEAAVSAIAEKHQASSPAVPQQPVFNEKTSLHRRDDSLLRPSLDGPDSSTPRISTSSNEGYPSEDKAAISGILKTIQKPLSTIGRIFSDDGGPSASGPSSAPRTPAPPGGLSPRRSREEGRDATQRPSSSHELSAEEAAARQASAEAAQAQQLHRAEHVNVVETLAGMFPDLDKDIISDVVYQKEGRVGLAVDACLALST
ncbi:Fc.00g064990.m01.CDS01 [Cosmosporella sp. VM-42]